MNDLQEKVQKLERELNKVLVAFSQYRDNVERAFWNVEEYLQSTVGDECYYEKVDVSSDLSKNVDIGDSY